MAAMGGMGMRDTGVLAPAAPVRASWWRSQWHRSIAQILRDASLHQSEALWFPHHDGALVKVDHLVLTYNTIVVIAVVPLAGTVRGSSRDAMWLLRQHNREEEFPSPLGVARRQAQAVEAALGRARLPVVPVVVFARAALQLAIDPPHQVCDPAGLAGLVRSWLQPDGEDHAALWRGLLARRQSPPRVG